MRAEETTQRRRFRVMGAAAEILWTGGTADIGEVGERRLRDLEGAWSRFLATSEVSRLNTAPADTPFIVSPETYALFEVAVRAWELTAGRFDPTLLDDLVAAGYDSSFEDVPRSRPSTGHVAPGPRHRVAGMTLDPVVRTVSLGPDVGFDPGGIGKGLAADIVTADLLSQGARDVLVNIGGDIRMRRTPGEDRHWCVVLEDPFDPAGEIGRITLADGAIATSSSLRRTWQVGDDTLHHILDPASGRPLEGRVAAVSVVAPAAWWAEALTKAVFVAGLDVGLELLEDLGVVAFVSDVDGGVHATGPAHMALAEAVTA